MTASPEEAKRLKVNCFEL